ncbi:MAG: AMP-binding protein [Bryobacteraceae bacterium]
MMDYPLTLPHVLERAARLFPKKEIASKMPNGEMHRYTFADFHRRTHQIAAAMEQLGIKPGDRVGTLCWNSYRHLELYFAITCSGAVMHTLNLRLASDQLARRMVSRGSLQRCCSQEVSHPCRTSTSTPTGTATTR